MNIVSLQADHFRNYDNLNIDFCGGTNLFYGENAQGKTNVLEALFLAGTTKSHRAGKDKEMIRFGQDEAHIRMEVEKNDVRYRIDMHLKKNRAKGIAINSVPIRRASELIGLCHFVFFSPEDLSIIKDGPGERRRFIDLELCQLSSMYVHALSGYNKVLAQRNRLLKDLYKKQDYDKTLDVWDEQLIRYGTAVIRERRTFVETLNQVVKDIHLSLSGSREQFQVEYEQSVSEEDFSDRLFLERERDIFLGTTGIGPHRDDLLFRSNEIDLRRYGSQGQQRTAALSLKLAEIEMVRRVTGDMPVLLLDDVLSELDGKRQKFLLERIRDIQTMITCTGIDDFTQNSFRIDRLFLVENGRIKVEETHG